MKVTIKNIIGILLLTITSLVSCNIKEDMSDCPGYIILDYTAYPDAILDEIDDESIVNIYIFDANDCCCDIISLKYSELKDKEYQMTIPIQYRGCDIVAWHGDGGADYNNKSMKIGASLEEFTVALKGINDGEFKHAPNLLWASRIEPIDFCAAITRHRIHMYRLHTEIAVDLKQVDNNGDQVDVDMSRYLVTVVAKDNVYRTDMTICNDSKFIEYNNKDQLDEQAQFDTAHVGTLRLDPNSECYLYITDLATGEIVTIGGKDHIDLIKYMLDSQSVSNDEAQLFLDLNKVWELSFTIDQNKKAICLKINGWVIWFDNTELD